MARKSIVGLRADRAHCDNEVEVVTRMLSQLDPSDARYATLLDYRTSCIVERARLEQELARA
jgi:hypothetical protein